MCPCLNPLPVLPLLLLLPDYASLFCLLLCWRHLLGSVEPSHRRYSPVRPVITGIRCQTPVSASPSRSLPLSLATLDFGFRVWVLRLPGSSDWDRWEELGFQAWSSVGAWFGYEGENERNREGVGFRVSRVLGFDSGIAAMPPSTPIAGLTPPAPFGHALPLSVLLGFRGLGRVERWAGGRAWFQRKWAPSPFCCFIFSFFLYLLVSLIVLIFLTKISQNKWQYIIHK